MGGVKYTFHGLREEDTLKTNNKLDLIELVEKRKRLVTLGIPTSRSSMLDMRRNWVN